MISRLNLSNSVCITHTKYPTSVGTSIIFRIGYTNYKWNNNCENEQSSLCSKCKAIHTTHNWLEAQSWFEDVNSCHTTMLNKNTSKSWRWCLALWKSIPLIQGNFPLLWCLKTALKALVSHKRRLQYIPTVTKHNQQQTRVIFELPLTTGSSTANNLNADWCLLTFSTLMQVKYECWCRLMTSRYAAADSGRLINNRCRMMLKS